MINVKNFILMYVFLYPLLASGQSRTKPLTIAPFPDRWDTLRASSSKHYLLHYLLVSEQTYHDKLLFKWNDEIFTDSFNNFSRLTFWDATNYRLFNIPTIPLTDAFILEKNNIIVGLSRYAASPYNIVIYSFDGKLLYKRQFSLFELKINIPLISNCDILRELKE